MRDGEPYRRFTPLARAPGERGRPPVKAPAPPARRLEIKRERTGTDVATPGRGPMVSCPAAVLSASDVATYDTDRVLTERFGLSAFHGWQREAIDALLEGSSQVLLVAPTGGG